VLIVASDGARLLRDEETLAALGYEPVGFTTAEAALGALHANPDRFDVLVVGPLTSPTSSLELATTMHAAAPHLPIVLATKSTEEVAADTLVNVGISDVVRWPIVAEEIAHVLVNGSALAAGRALPARRSLVLVAAPEAS
jgi:PleD family two-component response regulator